MRPNELPVFGITPAVEASDYYDPALLNLKEYSVGKSADASAPKSSMDELKLQRILDNCTNGGVDCSCKAFPEFWSYIVVPSTRGLQFSVRFGRPYD